MEKYTAVRICLQNHLLVVSQTVTGITQHGTLTGRGIIKEFSASSGVRMRRYLRCCVVDYTHFITLTYPGSFTRSGPESKEHLRRMLQDLKRNRSDRDKFSAFWFMEFQKRGAIHYHIFTTQYYEKDWLSRKWYEIVGSEDIRHYRAGTNIEKIRSGRYGTCAYASKYAAKSAQKTPPKELENIGRFWGVVGYKLCMAADILIKSELTDVPGIKKQLIALRGLLKEQIRQGKVKQLGQRGTCTVYFLKSPVLIGVVTSLMHILELKVACEGVPPLFLYPHHELVDPEYMCV